MPPPVFIASLKSFDKRLFLKKISHWEQRLEVGLNFHLK